MIHPYPRPGTMTHNKQGKEEGNGREKREETREITVKTTEIKFGNQPKMNRCYGGKQNGKKQPSLKQTYVTYGE